MSEYRRHTWEDGHPISPERLNNMETGITEAKRDATSALTAATAAKKAASVTRESVEHAGCYYRTVDGATEWVNPPMIGGNVYRTTQRFDGKVVYTQMYHCDSLPSVGSYVEIPLTVKPTRVIQCIGGIDPSSEVNSDGYLDGGDSLPYYNYKLSQLTEQILLSCTRFNVKIGTIAWSNFSDVTSFGATIQIFFTLD